jgi:cytidylate kinase
MAIITISRGSYTKGRAVAEKVAKKLGYEWVQRDVLLEASEEFHIPEIRLIRALHDAPSVLDRFTHGKQRYVSFIETAFLQHMQKDNVVYTGLAGHFFLPGVDHALKIRITANLEDRVQEEMKREGIGADDARHILKKDDEERRKWSLALYGIDTHDPGLYDAVINLHQMSIDCAVDTICQMAQSPCFATTEASQQAVQDLVLAAEVKSAVIREWPEVRVSAKGSRVFVDLDAPLEQEIAIQRSVSDLARTVQGVEEVRVNVHPRVF